MLVILLDIVSDFFFSLRYKRKLIIAPCVPLCQCFLMYIKQQNSANEQIPITRLSPPIHQFELAIEVYPEAEGNGFEKSLNIAIFA